MKAAAPASTVASQSSLVEAIYIGHRSWLQAWLRRRLGNAADAADLAHDTFIRILASRSTPARIEEPRAFLTTVARGVLVNWYQRQALEKAYLDALALVPEALAPSEEQRAIILETLHGVDTMLGALPAPVRQAFLLSQLDGLTYEDIALQLGVSLITVKRYMKRAFRECLALMED